MKSKANSRSECKIHTYKMIEVVGVVVVVVGLGLRERGRERERQFLCMYVAL